ncbi:hypothetical protein THAOC_18850, partial [Thalassiosira oceanica]
MQAATSRSRKRKKARVVVEDEVPVRVNEDCRATKVEALCRREIDASAPALARLTRSDTIPHHTLDGRPSSAGNRDEDLRGVRPRARQEPLQQQAVAAVEAEAARSLGRPPWKSRAASGAQAKARQTTLDAQTNRPKDKQTATTRSAASAWMCTTTRSNCRVGTASVKPVSTAGTRSPSMTSISPGTARCAGTGRSHREVISQICAYTAQANDSVLREEDKVGSEVRRQELWSSLLNKGHTEEEIEDMVQEYLDSQNLIPEAIADSLRYGDSQGVLDWLGSPVDAGKLNCDILAAPAARLAGLAGHQRSHSLTRGPVPSQAGVTQTAYGQNRLSVAANLLNAPAAPSTLKNTAVSCSPRVLEEGLLPETCSQNMKICGACGHELDKSRFSNKQWQLSRQKRRCRGCVDKRTSPGEGQASIVGTDDGHEAEPRVGRAGEGEADDVGCTNKSEGDADASVKPVSTAGMRSPGMTSISPGTARCAGTGRSHREVISQICAYTAQANDSVLREEDKVGSEVRRQELWSSLLNKGHTEEEIEDMVQEYLDSQNLIPEAIADSLRYGDSQGVLDWLGSPVDAGKLNCVYY